MTALTVYGSSVADTMLTTACDMAQAVGGGTETSKTTILTGTEVYGEVFSQGGTAASVATLPATPTGHGWVYTPGVGTYVEGNWSALITLSAASWGGSSVHGTITVRFFHYSGGAYTAIGQITTALSGTNKMTYSLPATSMPSITFGFNDLLYVDLWWFDDATNAGGDNPVLYVSTSATQGVAGDMQISTPGFASTAMLGYDPVGHQGVPIQVQDVQTDAVTGQQYGSVVPGNVDIGAVISGLNINTHCRGVKIVLNVTAIAPGDQLELYIFGYDPVSHTQYSLAGGEPIASISTTVYTIYPGITEGDTTITTPFSSSRNITVSNVLPCGWDVGIMNPGLSAVYTISACMIV